MNLPAVVKKTFEELRDQQEYISIVNFVVKAIRRLNTSIERARFIHKAVDDYNAVD